MTTTVSPGCACTDPRLDAAGVCSSCGLPVAAEAGDLWYDPEHGEHARSAPVAPAPRSGRYDPAFRRQAVRRGRERGCWLYVPASELVAAGIDLEGSPPLYRVWGTRGGGVFVRLYRER